jgi:hypothetical protein
MKKIIFLPLVIFLGASFLFFSEQHTQKQELQEFCREKAYLGMRIYDNIVAGIPFEEIVVYWKYPPSSYQEAIFREHWLLFLKTEVHRLVLEGNLSMRVQEKLYGLCLDRDEHYKDKQVYATNT